MQITSASLLVLALGGCTARAEPTLRCDSPTDRSPALGATFNVRLGERATLDAEGLTLTFESVVGDSRCPVGVTCVWEGNARVVVKAERPPAGPEALELNTSARQGAQAAYQVYEVRLLDVRPAPEHGRALDSSSYCVSLQVVRRAS
jgi:hypothetical protein